MIKFILIHNIDINNMEVLIFDKNPKKIQLFKIVAFIPEILKRFPLILLQYSYFIGLL
jgi:hypothetical protein